MTEFFWNLLLNVKRFLELALVYGLAGLTIIMTIVLVVCLVRENDKEKMKLKK